ncbi:proline racemase [Cytobacillus oceanisediminis]|uniref:Proline racemase n=1 Tax=Cytobacillus oceanisediminis TaxID=665099 RepID=A0A2V2ZWJ5_9BACI|nr:proline racemase family protein [Cytobacillus oceanisediminis]PWW28794.1 proline racemase [Cytobacillus oceanisediminis]
MKIQKAYSTTDVHVAGEAFRIISGAPFVHYQSLEQLQEQLPHVFGEEINFLLKEPRGFAGLNGCLVVPPISLEADAAVVFFNHEGPVPLQYGGVAAVITALLECGQLQPQTSHEYNIETISGVVAVKAVMEQDEVISVSIKLEPSKVIQRNVPLSLEGSRATYSLVQAGELYAVFNQKDASPRILVEELSGLKRWGQAAIEALRSSTSAKGVILMDDSALKENKLKSITFREDGYIVRSPGFGPGAACLASSIHCSGIGLEEPVVNESIYGGRLELKIVQEIDGSYQCKVTTRGFITGMQTFVLDPTDPLYDGFLLK